MADINDMVLEGSDELHVGDELTIRARQEWAFVFFRPDALEARDAFVEELGDRLAAQGVAVKLILATVKDDDRGLFDFGYEYAVLYRVVALDVAVAPDDSIRQAGLSAVAAVIAAIALLIVGGSIAIFLVRIDPGEMPRIADAAADTAREAGKTTRAVTLGAVLLGALYVLGPAISRRM